MSKISLGGIFGYVKSKFTPTTKTTDRFPRWWKHKETGRTVMVTTVQIAVGPDLIGKRIIFIDQAIGSQELAMPVQEFMEAHEKCKVQSGRS